MSWLSCIISNVVLASLVALTAYVVQRWLRQFGVARILWILALVKLVTPPLVSVPLGEPSGKMACALGICGCAQHAQALAGMWSMLPWGLVALWSAGAGATAWTAWRRWTQFQRLISHGRPAPPEWQSLAAHLAGNLGIRRLPEILAVPGRLPPLVVPGWRRPRVLLPMSLLDQLDASQRVALLLHELVHIKRGDHLVRLLELTVDVAFWWLPFIGAIGRQLRACEESCCDAAVVAHLPQARRDYARLLLDVLDFSDPVPRQAVAQATAMSTVSDLEQRLRAILSAQQQTRRTWPAAALALVVTCAVLPCELTFGLVRRPAPAAESEVCALAVGAENPPSSVRQVAPLMEFGCPE